MMGTICKNCGRALSGLENFCPHCGTKVEPLIEEKAKGLGTEEELKGKQEEEAAAEESKREFHVEHLDWDLDGYPSAESRKTEEVSFDWALADELGSRRRQEPVLPAWTKEEAQLSMNKDIEDSALEEVEIPKFVPPTDSPWTKHEEPEISMTNEPEAAEQVDEPEQGEEEQSASEVQSAQPEQPEETQPKAFAWEVPSKLEVEEALEEETEEAVDHFTASEEEILRSPERAEADSYIAAQAKSSVDKIDKFFTYNKTNEEFQELLDQEYGRIQEERGENAEQRALRGLAELAAQAEASAVIADSPVLQQAKAIPEEELKAPEVEESAQDLLARLQGAEEPQEEPVEEAAEETEDAEGADVPEEEEPSVSQEEAVPEVSEETEAPEEKKATLEEIFQEETETEKPVKKNTGLKILAFIILLLILFEVFVIAMKYLAPTSAFSIQFQAIYDQIYNFFYGLFQ